MVAASVFCAPAGCGWVWARDSTAAVAMTIAAAASNSFFIMVGSWLRGLRNRRTRAEHGDGQLVAGHGDRSHACALLNDETEGAAPFDPLDEDEPLLSRERLDRR